MVRKRLKGTLVYMCRVSPPSDTRSEIGDGSAACVATGAMPERAAIARRGELRGAAQAATLAEGQRNKRKQAILRLNAVGIVVDETTNRIRLRHNTVGHRDRDRSGNPPTKEEIGAESPGRRHRPKNNNTQVYDQETWEW